MAQAAINGGVGGKVEPANAWYWRRWQQEVDTGDADGNGCREASTGAGSARGQEQPASAAWRFSTGGCRCCRRLCSWWFSAMVQLD